MTFERLLRAPAKLNLRLRILAREASGYHQIETLFAAVDWGDRISVSWDPEGEGVELEVVGADLGPTEENLAYRAARAFLRASGKGGRLGIRLEKEIPAAAGLGGGSANAGVLLRALNELTGQPLQPSRLLAVAATLGADVPFFLSPRPYALAWGRGDRLLPLPPLPQASVLLALPPVRVETGWAYGLFQGGTRGGGAGPGPALLDRHRLTHWEGISELARNDFEAVVLPRQPLLRAVREGLLSFAPRFALLSGSGSSLYGVFETPEAARAAEGELATRFPDVRFVLTRTLEAFPWAEGDRPQGAPG